MTTKTKTAGSKRQAAISVSKRGDALLKVSKTYCFSTNVVIDQLDADSVRSLMLDGRFSSHIAERLVAARFSNVTRVNQVGASFDAILTDRLRKGADAGKACFEVKVMTKSAGVHISPSSMEGSQRKFDRRAFIKHLRSIGGVIVVDMRSFPMVTVRCFTVADLYALGDEPYPRMVTPAMMLGGGQRR